MIDWGVMGLILAYCAIRELFFMMTVNKLVNKLMSRNYHEYESAQTAYLPVEKKEKEPENLENISHLSEILS